MTDIPRKGRADIKETVESPPEFIPDPKITAKEEKFLKPTPLNKANLALHKTWTFLDEKKRNIGGALIGIGKLLATNGAVTAAGIVTPIGVGILILGIVHSMFKTEKKKKEDTGVSSFDRLIDMILAIVNYVKSLKKEKTNG